MHLEMEGEFGADCDKCGQHMGEHGRIALRASLLGAWSVTWDVRSSIICISVLSANCVFLNAVPSSSTVASMVLRASESSTFIAKDLASVMDSQPAQRGFDRFRDSASIGYWSSSG